MHPLDAGVGEDQQRPGGPNAEGEEDEHDDRRRVPSPIATPLRRNGQSASGWTCARARAAAVWRSAWRTILTSRRSSRPRDQHHDPEDLQRVQRDPLVEACARKPGGAQHRPQSCGVTLSLRRCAKVRQKIGQNRSWASEQRLGNPGSGDKCPANAHVLPRDEARPTGFEPVTFGSVDRSSNRPAPTAESSRARVSGLELQATRPRAQLGEHPFRHAAARSRVPRTAARCPVRLSRASGRTSVLSATAYAAGLDRSVDRRGRRSFV